MAHRPTPYSIALATLICLHCEENSPLYDNDDSNGVDPDFMKVDSFLQFLFLRNTDGKTSIGGNAGRLPQLNAAVPVHVLLKEFEKCSVSTKTIIKYKDWLHIASASIDSLTDLVGTLKRSVAEGTIDSSSSNGIFVRDVCLGFDELSFESTVKIWNAFTNELVGSNDTDDKSITPGWNVSSEQLEDSFRKQCCTNGVVSAISVYTMRQIQKLLDHNPELPSLHFMQFVYCLETGERVGAIDALHRYVDYVLINNEEQSGIEVAASEETSVQRNEEILQFAAILKTALHSAFGDKALAIAATEEAVRVAQQSQDPACVAFALGWLAVNAEDAHNASEIIQRCIQRATEGNLRSLAAGANLTLASRQDWLLQESTNAENDLAETRGGAAINAWGPWSDAFATDPTMSAADVDTTRWDRPTCMAHLSSGDEALYILARQRMVAAGIWDRYGQTSQSGLSALLTLHNHGDKLPIHDINVAIQNIGRRALFGSDSLLTQKVSHDCNLLHKYFDAIENSNDSNDDSKDHNCIYGNAICHIISLREAYNLATDEKFNMEIALIMLEWSVRRGDILQANALCDALESNLNPRLPNIGQLSVDVCLQKALLRARQGRHDEGKRLLSDRLKIIKSSDSDSDKNVQVARLLLQSTLISLNASQQEVNTSLAPLSECLALTKDHNMDGLHAAALSLLAQVHFRRGNHQQSSAIIQASLPSLFQHEHVWFQAEAYLTLGKCILKRAKHQAEVDSEGPTSKAFRKLLKLAIQKMKRSEDLFHRCHDCIRLKEVYYLQARIYNSLPDATVQRDEASNNFALLSQYLVEASSAEPSRIMSSLTITCELQKLAERTIPIVTVT